MALKQMDDDNGAAVCQRYKGLLQLAPTPVCTVPHIFADCLLPPG